MRLEDFTDANVRRCFGASAYTKADPWSLNDYFTALMGELGEAANIAQKVRRGDLLLAEARPALADEIADVFTYLDLLAHVAGVDLPTAVAKKWNEISDRIGWPEHITSNLGDA